tara:strand:- start:44577 stop:45392 length:816 start_codon:yes stop_codon:yes gene_type:complete
MPKHNKKRNTAIIYELLVREVVKQSIAEDKGKRNIAISILKEFFRKGTVLRKELNLYKTLLETSQLSEKLAEKLLTETLRQHSKLDQKELFKEQSDTISRINKLISKDVFSNFVPNYKDLATIAQIFSSNLTPKSKVLLENRILQTLISDNEKIKNSHSVPNLVMKSFVGRFNEAYKDMLEEQREILSKYINSFADSGTEFRFYLNEEIGRLKGLMESSLIIEEIKKDGNLKEKLHEVQSLLNNFNQTPVDKNKLVQVLKIQSLARELQSQ